MPSSSYRLVPRSIKDPITSNDANVGGFVNMLTAAKMRASNGLCVHPLPPLLYGDNNLPKKKKKLVIHYRPMPLQNTQTSICQRFFKMLSVRNNWFTVF